MSRKRKPKNLLPYRENFHLLEVGDYIYIENLETTVVAVSIADVGDMTRWKLVEKYPRRNGTHYFVGQSGTTRTIFEEESTDENDVHIIELMLAALPCGMKLKYFIKKKRRFKIKIVDNLSKS